MNTAKITWTHTDEAPALATKAFLPILKAYTKGSGVEIEKKVIEASHE
ncbi:NADP-dependent isocitrate dehydrogenase, partial [candidate division CSSED10-310 bacterium]